LAAKRKVERQASIWLCGEVNDEMLARFFEFFVQIDDPKIHITVHISSGGGDVDTGFAIHDALRSIPNPVTTIGYGGVGSIAVVIFCAGKERWVTKNTTVLIHPVSAEMAGDVFGMRSAVDAVMDSQKRIVQTIGQRSNDAKAVMKASTTETFLTAEQAYDLGIVTNILDFYE
jgi:ATP-dependent Clp protease protease subunit